MIETSFWHVISTAKLALPSHVAIQAILWSQYRLSCDYSDYYIFDQVNNCHVWCYIQSWFTSCMCYDWVQYMITCCQHIILMIYGCSTVLPCWSVLVCGFMAAELINTTRLHSRRQKHCECDVRLRGHWRMPQCFLSAYGGRHCGQLHVLAFGVSLDTVTWYKWWCLLEVIIIIIKRQFVRRRNMSVDTTRAPYRQIGNVVRDS